MGLVLVMGLLAVFLEVRVVLAFNDKPLSLVVEARAKAPARRFTALVGPRFSLFSQR